MRVAIGCSVCLATVAITSTALAAPQAESQSVHLQSFYELGRATPTLRVSDGSPWFLMKSADWADPKLLKHGYLPVMDDSKQYYCLIDKTPKIGSRMPEHTFLCGDSSAVEWLVDNNLRPSHAERAAGFYYTGP